MKKALKMMTWIVVLFLLVCVLALGALYFFADPNKLKPAITAEVKKRTGYQLVFDGKLSWSLYPQMGVKAEHVTLAEPGQQKPFVDLKRVNIAIEPLQLLYGTSKLRGEVHIAEVIFMNVHLTSTLVGLHWQDNSLILRPIQASFYNGSLSGMARGKDFTATPAWNWDITLSHVDMLPFIRDANGESSKLKLSGTGQVRINASTTGVTRQQMLSNLNGATDFSVQNGVVDGVDLNYLLKTADALLNKQAVAAPEDISLTKFDSFTGSMLLTSGVAQTSNLLLTAPAFKVKGQGRYNLPAKTIDLALQISAQQELNSHWDIPVQMQGELSHPTIALDMREINKQIATRELEKVKDKVREEIKDRVPGKAGEYLQSLLGK